MSCYWFTDQATFLAQPLLHSFKVVKNCSIRRCRSPNTIVSPIVWFRKFLYANAICLSVSAPFDFPKEEEKVIAFWREIDAFHTSLKLSEGRPEFSFYDGPPFATGLPHYGHLLAGTIKVSFLNVERLHAYSTEFLYTGHRYTTCSCQWIPCHKALWLGYPWPSRWARDR